MSSRIKSGGFRSASASASLPRGKEWTSCPCRRSIPSSSLRFAGLSSTIMTLPPCGMGCSINGGTLPPVIASKCRTRTYRQAPAKRARTGIFGFAQLENQLVQELLVSGHGCIQEVCDELPRQLPEPLGVRGRGHCGRLRSRLLVVIGILRMIHCPGVNPSRSEPLPPFTFRKKTRGRAREIPRESGNLIECEHGPLTAPEEAAWLDRWFLR